MVIFKHKKLNISVNFCIFALGDHSETLIIQSTVVSTTQETTVKNVLKTTIL